MKDEKKVDIFTEATKNAIKNKLAVVKEDNITTTNINLPKGTKDIKNWDDLKEAIDHKHAIRFNSILDQLPDREFVRVYLKSLEFFKPKIVRTPGGRGDDQPTVINIQVNYNK